MDTPLSKEIIVDSGTKVDTLRDPRSNAALGFGDENAVYIRAGGSSGEPDLVCTTMPVIIATGAAVIFLQLCILVTCVLCIYSSKRPGKDSDSSSGDHQSTYSSSTLHQRAPSTIYHDNLTYRPSTSTSSRIIEPTASTLKSLRTTLRD